MPTVLIHSLLHCGNLSFQSLKRDRYSRRRLCHLCGWVERERNPTKLDSLLARLEIQPDRRAFSGTLYPVQPQIGTLNL